MTNPAKFMIKDPLLRLARAWNRRVYLSLALQTAAIALFATAGAGVWFGWSPRLQILVFSLSGILIFALSALSRAGRFATPASMARHLNRIAPKLEESADLLVKNLTELTPLKAAQIKRIEPELWATAAGLRHHRRGLRRAWTALAASILLSLTLVLAGGKVAATLGAEPLVEASPFEPAQAVPLLVEPLRLVAVQITVTPPPYTGLKPFSQTELHLEVPEGAFVRWDLSFNHELAGGELRPGNGPSLDLKPAGGSRYSVQKRVADSGFYAIIASAENGQTLETAFYRLIVDKDRPARIRFTRPNHARTLLDPAPGLTFNLKAEIHDDYGITRAELLLTLTRGSGENVRFRERRLVLKAPAGATRANWNPRRRLDLAALGMEPGDELYFHLEVWDNREPEPNRTLSESLALIIRSRETPLEISSEGMAIDLVPEYFRSQRQIIIDSQKLIEDRPSLSGREFRRRSQQLGMDQKILRLKYGQFLGEEFESGIGLMQRAVASELADGDHDHSETFSLLEEETNHDHDDDFFSISETEEPEVLSNPDMRPFVHIHDNMEDATFFSEPVKKQLKQVLAHMWEAELYLRTFRPQTALPPEYRALKTLKEIQQAARAYVQRVGFEPRPIHEEEVRFSGDLSELENQSASHEFAVPEERRWLLAAMDAIANARNGDLRAENHQALDTFRDLIQTKAATDPRSYLETLNRIKAVLEKLDRGRQPAAAELDLIGGTIWNLLPPPASAPGRGGGLSDLAGAYLRHIGQVPGNKWEDPR